VYSVVKKKEPRNTRNTRKDDTEQEELLLYA